MPITLTCPSCRAPVEAADTDRGKTIHCGICWAEVPVPAGSGPVAAPAARLIPAAPAAPPAPAPKVPPSDTPPGLPPVRKAIPVPVPPADSPSKVAPALPTDQTADDIEVLSDAAADPNAPVAKALSAAPVAGVRAAPVAARVAPAKSASRGGPGTGSKFRPRDERDEDEDRPRGRERKGGGKGLLVVLLLVGGFLLSLAAGGAFLVYRFVVRPSQEFVEDVKKSAADNSRPNNVPFANPPGGRDPTVVNPPPFIPPKKPDWRTEWRPVALADGFTARMPGSQRRGTLTLTLGGERVCGHTYVATEASVQYRAQYLDLPDSVKLTAEDFARRAELPPGRGDPALAEGPTAVQVGGFPGQQLVFRRSPPTNRETVRVVKVGPRMFLFAVAYDTGRTRDYDGLDPEAKAREFFDSVKITFDPNTSAPAPTAKGPRNPRPKEPANPPRVPPQATPPADTTLPGSTGGLKFVARIDPFVTAVALPGKGEVLTFAVRDPGPQPGGEVRRYSAATWKLLGTCRLPSPVFHAAADEKAGRLYVATVARNARGPEVRDQLSAAGDVQAFDLKAVLSDTPPKDVLKSLAAAGFDSKVAGLEVDPNGKAVYAATAAQAGKGKPKVRLHKLDPADLKPLAGDIDVPQPAGSVWSPVGVLRMSPDGKHLFAAEFPYNSFGYPQYGASAPTTVHVVDAAGWKKERVAQLPGPAADLRFVDDGKAVAALSGGRARLVTLTPAGETEDVTPVGLRVSSAAFLAVAGDAPGKLVLSGRAGWTEVVVPAGGGWKAAGFATVVPGGGVVSGPAVASPDGKTVAYGSGAVLVVSAVGAKPGEN